MCGYLKKEEEHGEDILMPAYPKDALVFRVDYTHPYRDDQESFDLFDAQTLQEAKEFAEKYFRSNLDGS